MQRGWIYAVAIAVAGGAIYWYEHTHPADDAETEGDIIPDAPESAETGEGEYGGEAEDSGSQLPPGSSFTLPGGTQTWIVDPETGTINPVITQPPPPPPTGGGGSGGGSGGGTGGITPPPTPKTVIPIGPVGRCGKGKMTKAQALSRCRSRCAKYAGYRAHVACIVYYGNPNDPKARKDWNCRCHPPAEVAPTGGATASVASAHPPSTAPVNPAAPTGGGLQTTTVHTP